MSRSEMSSKRRKRTLLALWRSCDLCTYCGRLVMPIFIARESGLQVECYAYEFTLRGVEYRAASLDHVYPVSRGGTNQRTNIVLACRKCNELKGARCTSKP